MSAEETKKTERGGTSRRAVLGAGFLVGGVLGMACAPRAGEPGGDSDQGGAGGPADFELEEESAAELATELAAGQRSAVAVTQAYLERIEATNLRGPQLRAVLETNPDAVAIAQRLDQVPVAERGPLHGLPILLKDNVATADRNTTTAGSLALEGSVALRDAFIAERLRASGAILLGKANLSEWANFRSRDSSSGWSSRGGQCRNPYALDRNPCGSSSGSGVAASASLCAAAIGTETNGSIVCPASANGLVGVKPTVGLVSRSGIIPISATQDTAGPMARNVRDAALVLGALTGVDPADPATAASEGRAHNDYTSFLDVDGLRGARIGVGRQFFGFDERVDQLLERALADLRRLGAELVDPAEITTLRAFSSPSYTLMLYEFKAGLRDYFAGLGPQAPVRTLADVIAFNESHAASAMPFFGQDILLAAEEKGNLDAEEYTAAVEQALRLARQEGLDQTLDDDRLDAIVAPTGGPAWLTDPIHGDHFSGGSSSPAAISGYPNVTVPMGSVFGLPVGISFFGRAWSEPTLLRLAYAYEQGTQHRRSPRFLPSANLGAPEVG